MTNPCLGYDGINVCIVISRFTGCLGDSDHQCTSQGVGSPRVVVQQAMRLFIFQVLPRLPAPNSFDAQTFRCQNMKLNSTPETQEEKTQIKRFNLELALLQMSQSSPCTWPDLVRKRQ